MSTEVVGVPVSQAHRGGGGGGDAVVGVPITTRDEFDEGYNNNNSGGGGGGSSSPHAHRPVLDSRSEEPTPSRGPSSAAYGINASFGEASPSGGYHYHTTGTVTPIRSGGSVGGTPVHNATAAKKVVKISAKEVQSWKDAFHVTQETVIQALKEAKGDRSKTVELLQQGPSRLEGVVPANVEVKRNIIRISQAEITGFVNMFGSTQDHVIQVMREVHGDRDKAIEMLSKGAGLPAHAPEGFGTPGYFATSPATAVNDDDARLRAAIAASTNSSVPSGGGPRMSMEEANQLAAVFGVADRKEEVAEIVATYGSCGRDTIMNKLESLASQPPRRSGAAVAVPPPVGASLPLGGDSNAWDPSPITTRANDDGGYDEPLTADDIEIMTDDFMVPPTASAGPPPRNSRGSLPAAPKQNEDSYMAGGRTEQMLPPAPGSWSS